MLRCLRAPLRLGALILLVSGLLAAQPGARANSLSEFVFGYSKAVNAVALSANGRQAASGSQDNLLRLWDVPNGPAAANLRRADERHQFRGVFARWPPHPDGRQR